MQQREVFKTKMNRLGCAFQNHESNDIIGLCIELTCKLPQKAVCVDCYDFHINHRNKIISPQETEKILAENENLIGDDQNTLIPQMQIFKKIKNGIMKLLNEIEILITQPYREIKIINTLRNYSHENLNQLSQEIGKIVSVLDKQLIWKQYDQNEETTNEFIKRIGQQVRAKLFAKERQPEEKRMEFSGQYKAPEIILCASECSTTQVQGCNDIFWCLSENPVSNQVITRFVNNPIKSYFQKLKLKQLGPHWYTRIGLGSRSVMESQNFKFPLYNGISKNKGLYVMCSNGRTFQESKVNIYSSFELYTGDIIEFKYDPATKVLIESSILSIYKQEFSLNKLNQKLSYTFDIDGNETDLHFCVGYMEQGQSVEFMAK